MLYLNRRQKLAAQYLRSFVALYGLAGSWGLGAISPSPPRGEVPPSQAAEASREP